MKYIDKSIGIVKGNAITDHYLESTCRIGDSGGHYHYQNVSYDGSFGSTGDKNSMQMLALEVQVNFCCYCMRDLGQHNQRTTLEHIIPQKCTEEEFNDYVNYGIEPLTSKKVIRMESFVKLSKDSNIQVPPRPHTVTFENIVASCDGTFPDKDGTSQCCNNRRGQKKVFPLFYVKDVEDEIGYMQDGTMQPKVSCTHSNEYRQTIDNVKLNCPNLKDIRRLWHLFSKVTHEELELCVNNAEKRKNLLRHVLFQDERLNEQDANIFVKFSKDAYWQMFMLYHWFHHKL